MSMLRAIQRNDFRRRHGDLFGWRPAASPEKVAAREERNKVRRRRARRQLTKRLQRNRRRKGQNHRTGGRR